MAQILNEFHENGDENENGGDEENENGGDEENENGGGIHEHAGSPYGNHHDKENENDEKNRVEEKVHGKEVGNESGNEDGNESQTLVGEGEEEKVQGHGNESETTLMGELQEEETWVETSMEEGLRDVTQGDMGPSCGMDKTQPFIPTKNVSFFLFSPHNKATNKQSDASLSVFLSLV